MDINKPEVDDLLPDEEVEWIMENYDPRRGKELQSASGFAPAATPLVQAPRMDPMSRGVRGPTRHGRRINRTEW